MSITNFTFYSAVNDTVQAFNYPLVRTLTGFLIVSFLVGVILWNKNKIISAISFLLSIWFLSGTILCCIQDNDFVADWINSAVAIGTIGVVIITIYQMEQLKKDSENEKIKQMCLISYNYMIELQSLSSRVTVHMVYDMDYEYKFSVWKEKYILWANSQYINNKFINNQLNLLCEDINVATDRNSIYTLIKDFHIKVCKKS